MAIGDVDWDCSTNRPIIDEKTINPDTGAVQPASSPTFTGPPSIDIMWQNLHMDDEKDIWKLSKGPTGPSIDKVFIRIAKLVQGGWITLHPVTATKYTVVVVCESTATKAEFKRVAWNSGLEETELK